MIGRLEGELVSLINVYAPPGSDWFFFKQVFDLLTTDGVGMLIGGGDLNQRLNAQLDSSGKAQQKNAIVKKIKKIIS